MKHKWDRADFVWGSYYLCPECGEEMHSEADRYKSEAECEGKTA